MPVLLDDLIEFIASKEYNGSPRDEPYLILKDQIKKTLISRYWNGTVAVAVDIDYPHSSEEIA